MPPKTDCTCGHCGHEFTATPRGQHRIICGDSTDAATVKVLLNGGKPQLMVTDPPYGVDYDPAWRDRAARSGTLNMRKIGASSLGVVMNDTQADWREAWAHFAGDVAYVWHGGLHGSVVAESLAASGFEMRSQIIWAKQIMVISRGHYHWKHEPCWYAVRKGGTGHWVGDRTQTTVWDIAAKVGASKGGPGDQMQSGHGTQKPVECMRRPMLNNSKPGATVYDPFLGSGTTIIAAEISDRIGLGIELSPAYVDVSVLRWQQLTGQEATHAESGRTFAEEADVRRALPKRKGQTVERAPAAG